MQALSCLPENKSQLSTEHLVNGGPVPFAGAADAYANLLWEKKILFLRWKVLRWSSVEKQHGCVFAATSIPPPTQPNPNAIAH